MKTLVIHPKDDSTDFLSAIYNKLEDVTLVTGGWTQAQILEGIESHDQIMFMGHGSPGGLFSLGAFDFFGPILSYKVIQALKEKDNTIFIWCNADQFVKRYNLKGFYTGMFISEVTEAVYCGVIGVTPSQIKYSNDEFARLLGLKIQAGARSAKDIHKEVCSSYGLLAEINKVAKYNFERLYYNDKEIELTFEE